MNNLDVHLRAIAARDDTAFAHWLAGAETPLRRSLRSFAAQVDTEAVLQEALLRVWQVAPRVTEDGRPNALLRFALRVARNAAIDEVRRRRLEPLPQADLDEGAAPALPDPLLRQAIEQCRERLPPQPARALLARLTGAGGRSDVTLAEDVGMRLNTFLKNVGRARALLEACLRAAGALEGSHGS